VSELDVAVVSAERQIWSGKARLVITRTTEGDLGLLPGHEPMLANLATAPITIRTIDGDTVLGAVHGGFIAMSGNSVSILAETAELGADVDVDRARRAMAASEHQEDMKAKAAYERALARLTAAGEMAK